MPPVKKIPLTVDDDARTGAIKLLTHPRVVSCELLFEVHVNNNRLTDNPQGRKM
jgi:hypothetical protein